MVLLLKLAQHSAVPQDMKSMICFGQSLTFLAAGFFRLDN